MLYQDTKLSSQEFNKLSNFIYTSYGIKMPLEKKTMLESRLQKRLRALSITSFTEYCNFVFSPSGQKEEVIHMIDVVTTNKTDFFRESAHFDFMNQVALPEFLENTKGRKPLKIWSAGCSSGEEAYTISMVINEFNAYTGNTLDYSILGTDISSQILNKASTAIYGEDRIATIPLNLKKKYFLKSKNAEEKMVKIIPELRKKVSFKRLNFMDDVYPIEGGFDIVFCRNVLIYFNKNIQEKVINNLCSKLKPGGIFFLGHSESITDMQLPLQQLRPTIFRRK